MWLWGAGERLQGDPHLGRSHVEWTALVRASAHSQSPACDRTCPCEPCECVTCDLLPRACMHVQVPRRALCVRADGRATRADPRRAPHRPRPARGGRCGDARPHGRIARWRGRSGPGARLTHVRGTRGAVLLRGGPASLTCDDRDVLWYTLYPRLLTVPALSPLQLCAPFSPWRPCACIECVWYAQARSPPLTRWSMRLSATWTMKARPRPPPCREGGRYNQHAAQLAAHRARQVSYFRGEYRCVGSGINGGLEKQNVNVKCVTRYALNHKTKEESWHATLGPAAGSVYSHWSLHMQHAACTRLPSPFREPSEARRDSFGDVHTYTCTAPYGRVSVRFTL